MNPARSPVEIRNTRPKDFEGIIEMCRDVYRSSPPWRLDQLASHLRVFPEGQFVAIDPETNRVAGMAASLIVRWDNYQMTSTWRDFTAKGMFTNHDPVRGRTLYGAEVMVGRSQQRRGIGSKLYRARRELVQRLGLRRIRAGARLRGYGRHADQMTAEEYVIRVIRGECRDPTLSFQLQHGFEVVAVVSGYLAHDEASRGYAAIIEWLNPAVVQPRDVAGRDPRFQKPVVPTGQ